MVIRDIVTRWNYTHAMIERALMLRRAIDRWVRDYDELAPLMLRQEDWEQLEHIKELLEVSF